MEGLRKFIRDEVFDKRSMSSRALVIYDPERRYREIAVSMAHEGCKVLEASASVIEQREVAMRAMQELGAGKLNQLVVWTPAKAPVRTSDEDYQQDPFAVLARMGAQFPDGDGDSYHSICRRAKPDHLPEIDRLFAGGQMPTFEMVDALDKGGSWPRLKTLLGVESSKDVLLAVLCPKDEQREALGKDDTWVDELRDFVQRILGHTLKTKGRTLGSLADELWRVLLFSEFAFDLEHELPPALQTMPCMINEARNLVYEVCDNLRKHADHKVAYMDRARDIEEQINLAAHTKDMAQLGRRDTFPCEERRYLQVFVEKALNNQLAEAQGIWQSRQGSIWLNSEERLAEWTLAVRAMDLIDAADRLCATAYPDLAEQIRGYAAHDKELDRLQRELEQASSAWEGNSTGLEDLVRKARSSYAGVVERNHARFIAHVHQEGWPATGSDLLWNAQLFNKQVAPALDAGERVAYVLVDSLRYELGVELEKQLSEKHKAQLHTVCAQLPTYTEVGMASLMPNADKVLKLLPKNGELTTTLDGEAAIDPAGRLAHLKRIKGDQCQDVELAHLLKKRDLKLDPTVKLLVVRTRDIDTLAHQSPHEIHALIPKLLRSIMQGISRLAELGFQRAIIATDHGFMLFHEQAAGDVAPKPQGQWLVEKSRCVLGDGSMDEANMLVSPERLSIPAEVKHFGTPRNLVPYQRGTVYFHEGLSLQECVLPCLNVVLKAPAGAKASAKQDIAINYRQGRTDKITSRRPVLDLVWTSTDLFAAEQEMELTVVAVNAKGVEVGRAASGPTFNPATGGVRLRPGQALPVGLSMDDDHEGQFKVKVLDPGTDQLIAEVTLKTAYLQ